MCVVKGPAQGAMVKTKRVEREKKTTPSQEKETRAQAESKESTHFFEPAYSKITPPPSRPLNEDPQSRPLNEEDPQSRPLNKEDPQSRALEEDTARLSASSEEAVLDTSLSAQAKERASTSMHVTIMSKVSTGKTQH